MSTIILASGSKLRRFIMDKTGLTYTVMEPNIDETIFDDYEVSERVRLLAEEKCRVIADKAPHSIVIASDTLTEKGGVVFSKPKESFDPYTAAMELSGETIMVHTGCAVFKPGNKIRSVSIRTRVTYQKFDKDILSNLLKDDDFTIRSGALGIFFDSPGFTLIERIEGSYSGAFGLPMEFIYKELMDVTD